jgi:hypothetical protein
MSESANPDSNKDSNDDFGGNWDWGWRGDNSWIWGLVLVVGGGLLLIQNFTNLNFINFGNWWAVFILVPGINSLAQASRQYRAAGRLSPGGQRAALWGLFWIGLAATFFFSLDFGLIFPIFLVFGGLVLLWGSMQQE